MPRRLRGLRNSRGPRSNRAPNYFRQYIEAQTGNQVVLSWQGGEPTLLGREFFRKVVALEARYKKPHQHIENDLQTNGTLLDGPRSSKSTATELEHLKASIHKDFGDVSPADNGSSGFAGC